MSGQVLSTMKTLDVETGDWKIQSQALKIARKDHACAAVRWDFFRRAKTTFEAFRTLYAKTTFDIVFVVQAG